MYLLPLKRSVLVSLEPAGPRLCQHRAREIWVQVPVAFEGSYLFVTQGKPSPPTHPWGCRGGSLALRRRRDKSQWVRRSARARRWWGLWYHQRCRSSARRKSRILGETAAVGGERRVDGGTLSCRLLPPVPVGEAGDPQLAAPPGELPAPGFSHAYTAAIHFVLQNKPCRKRPHRCRAFPHRQWV